MGLKHPPFQFNHFGIKHTVQDFFVAPGLAVDYLHLISEPVTFRSDADLVSAGNGQYIEGSSVASGKV